MAKPKTVQTPLIEKLVIALAGNPEIYKGTAGDASIIVKLAQQIVSELGEFSEAGS